MTLKRHSVASDPSIAFEIARLMEENVVVETLPSVLKTVTVKALTDVLVEINSPEIVERTDDSEYNPITGQKKTSRRRQDTSR